LICGRLFITNCAEECGAVFLSRKRLNVRSDSVDVVTLVEVPLRR
jgi:hypothetical protein